MYIKEYGRLYFTGSNSLQSKVSVFVIYLFLYFYPLVCIEILLSVKLRSKLPPFLSFLSPSFTFESGNFVVWLILAPLCLNSEPGEAVICCQAPK